MRHIALAVLLLTIALPPASAAESVVYEVDVMDALADSRAYPDVRLPQTDIARFTTKLDGADVVQTVHVVGPWPANNYWVEVRNDFGSSQSLTLKVERTNSSGSGSTATDYPTSSYSTLDPASIGKRVNFTFEREGNSMSFRWAAADIPSTATCVAPRVTTLSRTTVDGQSRQVDDDLVVVPSLCNPNILKDGLSGSCDAPTTTVVKPLTIPDARDDVGERDNLGFRPHDNATLDILSVDTRIEDGWVVQTVLLAESSPRDQVMITIENQITGNKSEYSPGQKLTLTLFETDASGSVPTEQLPKSLHVRATRAEPAGWEFRWCASAVPADATCFATTARASLENGRYRDSAGLARDPCPAPGEEQPPTPTPGGDGTMPTPAGGEDEEGGAGAEKGAPGIGAVALAVTLALVALAFRRRG